MKASNLRARFLMAKAIAYFGAFKLTGSDAYLDNAIGTWERSLTLLLRIG